MQYNKKASPMLAVLLCFCFGFFNNVNAQKQLSKSPTVSTAQIEKQIPDNASSNILPNAYVVGQYKGMIVDTTGKVLVTSAVQLAIDAANAAGGGTVYFLAGKYLTSTFFLKSNVTIYLTEGAHLLASTKAEDYKFTKGIIGTETDVPTLINANKANHISITGFGTINGQAIRRYEDLKVVDNFIRAETENARQAGEVMKRFNVVEPKVCLLYIINCQDVKISGISIIESPNWTVHLANCARVSITDTYIYSSLTEGVNADGIDIDGCKDVLISHCNVQTGDDAICLKSTNNNGNFTNCENITVTGCNLQSTSTALKIGTESHGDFRNIVFSNSTISNTNRGIGIFIRDGGNIDGIIFSNLTIDCKRKPYFWWGDGDAIRFVLLKRKPESRLGSVKNVLIENVIATQQGTSLIAGYTENNLMGNNAVGSVGTPKVRQMESIRLSNVSITTFPEVGYKDLRATSTLCFSQIAGLDISNANFGFGMTNVVPAKWNSVLRFADIQDASLSNVRVPFNGIKNTPLIDFNNVNTIYLQGVRPLGTSTTNQQLFGFKGCSNVMQVPTNVLKTQ